MILPWPFRPEIHIFVAMFPRPTMQGGLARASETYLDHTSVGGTESHWRKRTDQIIVHPISCREQ